MILKDFMIPLDFKAEDSTLTFINGVTSSAAISSGCEKFVGWPKSRDRHLRPIRYRYILN